MTMNTLYSLSPTEESFSCNSIDEVFKLAELIAKSEFFLNWKNKPHDAAVAIMFGKSLGLSWGHSLLNISVINGRPTVWGDGMLALCKKSPSFEDMDEEFNDETKTAICIVKRKGQKEQVRTFSYEDAQRAGLVKKDNWIKYLKRMLQMRARTFALRDVFPDVLQGLGCAEEVMDYPDSVKPKMGAKNESNIVSFPAAQSAALPEPVLYSPSDEKETVTLFVSPMKCDSVTVALNPYPVRDTLSHRGCDSERSPCDSLEIEKVQGKEPSPELQQFVDNLAKFDKSNGKQRRDQSPDQPKTSVDMMRERMEEQKRHQLVKGMEALARLKQMTASFQSQGQA